MIIKKISYSLLIGFTLLITVILLNTFTVPSGGSAAEDYAPVKLDAAKISQHLSAAVTFKTVSKQNLADMDYSEFTAFIAWLAITYPEVHAKLELITINEFTLLYKWQGQDASLPPILLSGHYDVVPVILSSESAWTHPPYAGVIDDDYIWGRGTLDDKSAVIGMLEALSVLVAQNFAPQRTIYVAATHDEEIGSEKGAAGIVTWMKANNVKPIWSLDEGSFVLNGMIPGVDKPVASINVSEKGYMNLELKVTSEGGHSSMPKGHTAVGVLSTAIHNLQNSPLEGSLNGISGQMFDHLAPHMPFVQKLLFANKWLFSGLIERELSKSAGGNAMLRTTIAPTMVSGSIKANVLPINASAIVNFRLHPKDSLASVVEHVTQAINDKRVIIRVITGSAASPISSYDSSGFKEIAAAAKHVHGSVVVTPGITIAATDSRKYKEVVKDSYRFNPMSIHPQDFAGFHGTNERLSIDNMVKATEFYIKLMRSATE
jgi:carboxypeptidase PM20D1